MTSRHVARGFIGATLFGVAFLLGCLVIGQAKDVHPAIAASLRAASDRRIPSRISLRVAVGYQNIYRGTNWTPVRVTVSNGTNTDISGILEIPQSDQSSSVGASPSFHGLYQAPVTLPAGVTKHITVSHRD